jgi:hypothetical protein
MGRIGILRFGGKTLEDEAAGGAHAKLAESGVAGSEVEG